MKRIYLLLILPIVFSLALNAQQVPNGGFETWTNAKNPDGWFTFSSISVIASLASKDTADKVEGTASAKIQTATISGSTTYEILSLGTADYSITATPNYTYHPVSFTHRPDTLFFSYTYSTPGPDTASVYIKLSDGNTTLLQKLVALDTTSQWTNSYILLSPLYLNANNPDSLLIQFKSSIANGAFYGTNGSTLNVDAVRFGYVTNVSAIEELTTDYKLSIYPNPAAQSIHVDCKSGFQIYSSTGQLVKQSNVPTSTIIINDLPLGLYLLKSGNNIGRFIKIN